MTENNNDPRRKWALLLVQASVLVTIVSFCWYESGFGFDELRQVGLIAGISGAIGAILNLKFYHRVIDSNTRTQAIERSMRQSKSEVPWYSAPVLWVPLVMLLTIWYFQSRS